MTNSPNKIHVVVGYDGDYLLVAKNPAAFTDHRNAEIRAEELQKSDKDIEWSTITLPVADLPLKMERPDGQEPLTEFRPAPPIQDVPDDGPESLGAAVAGAWASWIKKQYPDDWETRIRGLRTVNGVPVLE